MDTFVILKKDDAGHVIESTVPLPKDYVEELVPPFPVDTNLVIEPYKEVTEEKDNAPILG